jgi:hypothetical protein
MTGNGSRRAPDDNGAAAGATWRSGRVRAALAALIAVVAIVAIVIVAAQLSGGPANVALPPSGGRSTSGAHSSAAVSPGASSAGRGHSAASTPAGSSPAPGRSRTSPKPSSTLPAVPSGSLVPGRGAMFGSYAEPTGGDNYVQFEGAILALQRELGRKLAIDNLYDKWTHPLPIRIARWDLSQGILPMISWAGARTNLITAGRYDQLIRSSARELRALHRPVMLRWFYEMDGSHQSPLVQSPASFVAAWRHVHNIFARAGASNVSWVWCPNALHFVDGIAQRYYPGGRYVNWVCADGYNWAPKLRRASWRSFASIFSTFYHWGISTGKPLMVGEFGVMERTPGEKAAWYRQTDFQLRTMFPAIRAVVYFNSDHEGYNWRVTTSQSSLAAFRAFARDGWFSARPRL